MEMLRRVLVLRRIATAHVPALQTKPQMDPGIAGLDAILANVLVRFGELDLVNMSAA
jgi:hypothetical protein